jgi:uncharacterized RDD family membrane protein YckC
VIRNTLLLTRRCCAILLDIALLTSFSIPLVFYLWKSGDLYPPEMGILLWIWLLYFWLLEWRRGATWGKFMVGLRVSRVDGSPLRWWQAGARTLLFFFLPSLLSMWIVMLFRLGFTSSRSGLVLGSYLDAIVMIVVPLSVVLLGVRTSVVDIVVGSKIDSQLNPANDQVSVSRRRWILLFTSLLLVGLVGSWSTLKFMSVFSPAHPERATEEMIDRNRNAPLLNGDFMSTLVTVEGKRIIMGGVNGTLVRQKREDTIYIQEEQLSYWAQFDMPQEAGSFEELAVMNNFSSALSKLPDEERPPCVTLHFIKSVDVIFVDLDLIHRVKVCVGKRNESKEIKFIDENEYFTLKGKFEYASRGLLMTGEYKKYEQQFVEESP